MQKFDVQIALEGVAEARREWNKAVRKFNADVDKVMTRLLHEAAANFMSAEQVAKHAGLSPKRVRSLMRLAGLNPRDGKRLLAKHAADALQSNADLLGIAPHEMDLMSPLAYLPMGSVLRQQLTDKTISQVTELTTEYSTEGLEDVSGVLAAKEDQVYEVAYLLWQFNQGYILAEDRTVSENWMLDHKRDGTPLHEDDARELPGWLDAARQVIALVSGNSQ